MLGQLINSVSCHALDSSRTPSDESICADLLDVRKIGEEVFLRERAKALPMLPLSRKSSNILESSTKCFFIHLKENPTPNVATHA